MRGKNGPLKVPDDWKGNYRTDECKESTRKRIYD